MLKLLLPSFVRVTACLTPTIWKSSRVWSTFSFILVVILAIPPLAILILLYLEKILTMTPMIARRPSVVVATSGWASP